MLEQAFLLVTQAQNPDVERFREQRVNMPISCVLAQPLLEVINKYEERPVWMGDTTNTKTKFVLFVNQDKKSWTLINFTDDQTGCILGAGDASNIKR